MRATKNRQRVSELQAQESLRRDATIDAELAKRELWRYMPDDIDDDGKLIPAASDVMVELRELMQARLDGTLYKRYPDRVLWAIADVCVPAALTYDETRMGRGFFAAYAAAMMQYATTSQLDGWVYAYRNNAMARGDHASEMHAREVMRGLAQLRSYLHETYGLSDRSPYARPALYESIARRMASTQEHRAWHKLTDGTHAYVGTGKLTRRERAAKYGHAARRARQRARKHAEQPTTAMAEAFAKAQRA